MFYIINAMYIIRFIGLNTNVKCVPALLYGLDACPINISDKRSLDFVFTRDVLMKLFKTSSNNIVDECYEMFNLKHMSQLISERKCMFLGNFHRGNELCNLIENK